MQDKALPFQESVIDVAALKRYADGWILDSEYRQLSEQTIYSRRLVTDKLLGFLKQREYTVCGAQEIRAFLAYLSTGHEDALGRWGNAQLTKRAWPLGQCAAHEARLAGDGRDVLRSPPDLLCLPRR